LTIAEARHSQAPSGLRLSGFAEDAWTPRNFRDSGLINHGPTRFYEETLCKLMSTSDSDGNFASKCVHYKVSLARAVIWLS
jgi:hypothetical protein